ncbi:hypothetical protein LEP1GSC170_2678 [Leptospira interrogans serovar Bataviae str. HAI135]|nr:hypothetical protein LEP1GSC170_2678 [Leptospira interrogans serovar Bataviae str. HAI135]
MYFQRNGICISKVNPTILEFVLKIMIRSSSHNFQSFTAKSTICESSHIYFFTKKLT